MPNRNIPWFLLLKSPFNTIHNNHIQCHWTPLNTIQHHSPPANTMNPPLNILNHHQNPPPARAQTPSGRPPGWHQLWQQRRAHQAPWRRFGRPRGDDPWRPSQCRIGSMYGIYGVPWIPSIYPKNVSIFLPAPWILWVYTRFYKIFQDIPR